MGRDEESRLSKDSGIRRRRIGGRYVYEINFYDQHGKRRFELAGATKRQARIARGRRLEEVAAGTYRPGASARMTLDELADLWVAQKTREGMRSLENDERRYRLHVAPVLGTTPIAALTPKAVADLVATLAAGKHAAKTVRNIHGALHSILELARFEQLIDTNPASLPRGKLPKVGKKKKPRFSRDEVWQLLTDPAIEQHRRVFYALMGLGDLHSAGGDTWLLSTTGSTRHPAERKSLAMRSRRPLRSQRSHTGSRRTRHPSCKDRSPTQL